MTRRLARQRARVLERARLERQAVATARYLAADRASDDEEWEGGGSDEEGGREFSAVPFWGGERGAT